ncbi:MAG: hypothetical protein H0T92_24785 [Pyrinomonadaceae bacterium]|nr:hypothetical protein [Pyrinomonadaceae bacterium]
MTAKHESAELILKLYELRREETMRKARDWYIRQFHPQNVQDIINAWRGEHSAYYRMVTSYWDMAASFVNHGAIDEQMFGDANPEHMAVFAKLELFLEELRSLSGIPNHLQHLEQLVIRSPGAKERTTQMRERFKQMAAMRAEAG